MTHDYKEYEKKWQNIWESQNIGDVERDKNKPKYFLIWAYLTVSGFHHVGHMRGYSYADAIARYKRMNGYNVLLCAGGHASGNAAVAKAMKVKNNDSDLIEYYKSMGLTAKDIEQIKTPEGFVNFFSKRYIKDYKRFGFIGDWRRFTVTTYPDYQKFIEWQFKKLKEKNLLIQKPYYATSCIRCGPVAVDPSEMDLQKGGNAEKVEFTILKLNFEKQNQYIVAATLRPETIFGETNIWIDPNTTYVKIKVNNEIWIGTKEFAEKLKYQKEGIEIIGEISGKEMIGKYCIAPLINKKIIILPSKICNPNIGTGIVTSVPSDAPVDWIALFDLQKSEEECKKYGLNYELIKNIKPIPIIKSKGYGEYPAQEICNKLNIKSQEDKEKLEIATKEIYKKGFHTGIMNNNCGKYINEKVEIAKEKIKNELKEKNLADTFYDLSEDVICRCGDKVVIKKIEDQWFIKYSDKNLTNKTIEHTKNMNILPPEFKTNLPNILNWFDDRACARKGKWLGTKLPFDSTYIIEPISDSTLYPIYYLVSLYVNQGDIKSEQLTEEFFDYIFFEKGDINKIAADTKISKELILKIRKDVEYWYALDLNIGGQEHQTVHFPTFLMNHIAILPEKYWPKGILVNWWVVSKEGKIAKSKISKSKGGVKSLGEEANVYSVDAIRLFYANIASPYVNIEFTENDLLNYKQRLEKIFTIIEELVYDKKLIDKNEDNIDLWLLSKFNNRLKNIISNMDKMEFKGATDEIYYNIYNDILWYKKRGGTNKKTITEVLRKWVLTLGIFTPHLAEELNEIIGNKYLVTTSKFPNAEDNKINVQIEKEEEMIDNLSTEIRNIIKMANIEKPKKITLVVADEWKYDFLKELSEKINQEKNVGMLINYFIKKYPENKEIVSKTINKVIKLPIVPQKINTQKNELEILNNAKQFYEQLFECTIEIGIEKNINDSKAKTTMPGRIGIIVK